MGAVDDESAPSVRTGSGVELDSNATMPPEVSKVAAMAAEAIFRRNP